MLRAPLEQMRSSNAPVNSKSRIWLFKSFASLKFSYIVEAIYFYMTSLQEVHKMNTLVGRFCLSECLIPETTKRTLWYLVSEVYSTGCQANFVLARTDSNPALHRAQI
jgi:hypothetical protein